MAINHSQKQFAVSPPSPISRARKPIAGPLQHLPDHAFFGAIGTARAVGHTPFSAKTRSVLAPSSHPMVSFSHSKNIWHGAIVRDDFIFSFFFVLFFFYFFRLLCLASAYTLRLTAALRSPSSRSVRSCSERSSSRLRFSRSWCSLRLHSSSSSFARAACVFRSATRSMSTLRLNDNSPSPSLTSRSSQLASESSDDDSFSSSSATFLSIQ